MSISSCVSYKNCSATPIILSGVTLLSATTTVACTVLQAQGNLFHLESNTANYFISTGVPIIATVISSISLFAKLYCKSNLPISHLETIFIEEIKNPASKSSVLEEKTSADGIEYDDQYQVDFLLLREGPFNWKPKPLAIEKAIVKMYKNSQKALAEHISRNPHDSSCYPKLDQALPPLEFFSQPSRSLQPAQFIHSVCEKQGPRESMEDAHFFLQFDEGALIGVLDGHGGSEVSKFASALFRETFPEYLKIHNGNILNAFEALFYEIDQQVFKRKQLDLQGTTVVLSFIDKNYWIITATLGDSETNIYRKIDGIIKSIPHSCVRDWSCPKDARRAALGMGLGWANIETEWPKESNPKLLRYPAFDSDYGRLNVSRSIGDYALGQLGGYFVGNTSGKAISPCPKISINLLQPGDLVTLRCDGINDYLSETYILKILNHYFSESPILPSVIEVLAAEAENNMMGDIGDNITIVGIQIT